MHALAAVNTPIRGWQVYQTQYEYWVMVEGNLVVTYLMMFLAMLVEDSLPG